jgi:hypothetical protein
MRKTERESIDKLSLRKEKELNERVIAGVQQHHEGKGNVEERKLEC